MSALTSTIAEFFRCHHGVASREELLTLGMSTKQIDQLVADGLLVPVHPGVYRIASSPLTFEASCRAACAAAHEAVVCGASAARLWGLRTAPRSTIVQVLVPDRQTPLSRGVRVRRCRAIEDRDVVRRDDGIRLTSPPRTLLEVATSVSDLDLESMIEQVLDSFCGPPEVWGVLRRVGARGRPGTARLRRVLDSRPIWHKPKDSHLEVVVLDALRRHGIHLEPQVPLAIAGFPRIHLDGADRELRWGVEIDHVTWHGGRAAAQRDKARDRACRRIGWVVERVTDDEIRRALDQIVSELVHSYRSRMNELRPARVG